MILILINIIMILFWIEYIKSSAISSCLRLSFEMKMNNHSNEVKRSSAPINSGESKRSSAPINSGEIKRSSGPICHPGPEGQIGSKGYVPISVELFGPGYKRAHRTTRSSWIHSKSQNYNVLRTKFKLK